MTVDLLLVRCIEALEQGESIESCLAACPELAGQVEPLLRIAMYSQGSALTESSQAAQTQSLEFGDLLYAGIEALARGEGVDAYLAAHPASADRLEPLLRL